MRLFGAAPQVFYRDASSKSSALVTLALRFGKARRGRDLSDGSEGAPLDLRGLFKQFLDEVAPRA
jgi:hypothetical protein